MTDHMRASSRLAPLFVCAEQPDWRLELLTALCAVLMIATLVVLAQLAVMTAERDVAVGERDLWMRRVVQENQRTAVRLDRQGRGYQCTQFNVRREWGGVVAAQCKAMGELLYIARTSP